MALELKDPDNGLKSMMKIFIYNWWNIMNPEVGRDEIYAHEVKSLDRVYLAVESG